MRTYLAFLRGVNVGGHALVKMSALAEALADAGLADVKTYIQSGNVIFSSDVDDTDTLAALITATIQQTFHIPVDVVVFSKNEWQHVINAAPKWWGADKTQKHNLLIMIKPSTAEDAVAAMGTLKPDIETAEPGNGVVYQSLSLQQFGKTTAGKLISSPIYKKMTIRNYNTATKLASLLAE